MSNDFVGIAVILGLVVLAVPVLLVVALIKISNAKARIETLEYDVARLQAQVRDGIRVAPSSTSQAQPQPGTWARTQAAAAPPPASVAADVPEPPMPPVVEASPVPPPAATPGTPFGRARFDLPDDPLPETQGAKLPPPLPKTQAPSAGAQAAPGHVPPPRPQRPSPPPSDPVGDAVGWVKRWFTEGNVPVKIGVLVLFAGVAALLKYASDQGWMHVPMQLRLAGIAMAAIGALVFAWRKREEKRSFALSIQGGAIGVLMLVTFAAFKLYGFIDAGPAFAITVVLVAGLGVLAVLQNAMALAVFGILAGFLAPIWLSTGSGNHVALFSYYAVLNLGIFGIAWNRPWRLLNLLGFAFTFGIGTVWGVLDYQPEKFATTEPFLVLFFLLYLLIPLFYAWRRDQEGRGGDNAHALVDGTLVFGTPLVVFALQAALLQGNAIDHGRMPLAFSALAMAVTYLVLALLLRGRERFASLVDTWIVLAVGFATLAVPLALSARATASVFALEGAGLVWLGLRQERRLPQLSGLLLQVAAAIAYIAGIGGMSNGFAPMAQAPGVPLANPAFMSALLLALAGFATAWSYRRHVGNAPVAMFSLWSLLWWCVAGFGEIKDFVPHAHRIDAGVAFIVFTGWIAAELRRRFDDMVAFGGAAAVALLLGVPAAFAQTAEHVYPLGEWGAATWLMYAALGWRSLICLRDTGSFARLLAHGGWWWSWVVVVMISALHFAEKASLGEGWRLVAAGVPVLAFAALLRLRPALPARPMAEGFDDYRRPLSGSAVLVLALMWAVSLFNAGGSAPLPWLTVLNPLELWQLATLALMAHWAWSEDDDGLVDRHRRVPIFALTAFVWITFATLRALHHWGHVGWSPSMLEVTEVQTALTVVWSVLGVLGWIFGSRRGDRLLWGAGAVLMAVVLLKLVLVDRHNMGNLFGIVSFLAYGLLCTAVGYFAPAPPRRQTSTETMA